MQRYNAAAVSVMNKVGVPVNDLHKVVEGGGNLSNVSWLGIQ